MASRGYIRRFLNDERGNLTMEFMLWLPILLIWFVVSVNFYGAYIARMQAVNAADIVTDIVARSVQLEDTPLDDDDDFDELSTLLQVLVPAADGPPQLRVTSILFEENSAGTEADDTYCLHWSVARDDALYPAYDQSNLDTLVADAGFMAKMVELADQQHVLMVDIRVPFTPFADWVGLRDQDWVFRNFIEPRFGSKVDLKGVSDPC